MLWVINFQVLKITAQSDLYSKHCHYNLHSCTVGVLVFFKIPDSKHMWYIVPCCLKSCFKDIVKLSSPPLIKEGVSTGQVSSQKYEPELFSPTFGALIRMSKQASQHMWRPQSVCTFQQVSQSPRVFLPFSHELEKIKTDHPPAELSSVTLQHLIRWTQGVG